VSSSLKGGSSHTELALAMREFSLVGKWVEGRWVLLQTTITTAERKLFFIEKDYIMEKVIENGQVAVIYSPGFGAGWYTWNEGRFPELNDGTALLFDPILVDLVKQKQANQFDEGARNEIENQIVARAEQLCPEGYFGGVEDLVIEWMPIGTEFEVDEYDGSESISYKEHSNWITA
jgi:hypothetical protein